MAVNGAADLVHSHEARLQRMETQIPDLSSQVATVSIQVEHMSQSVDDMRGEIKAQLETMGDRMDSQFNKVAMTMDILTNRVGIIEKADQTAVVLHAAEEAKKATWLSLAKKAAIPVAVLLSALATKLGEALWVWLSH